MPERDGPVSIVRVATINSQSIEWLLLLGAVCVHKKDPISELTFLIRVFNHHTFSTYVSSGVLGTLNHDRTITADVSQQGQGISFPILSRADGRSSPDFEPERSVSL